MAKNITIAFPANQMTQRYIGSRTLQGKELMFYLPDGSAVSGFVTGMDDDNIQVCDAETFNATLVSTSTTMVKETGRTFSDFDGEEEEQLRRYTKIFRRIVERELDREDDE